ncbi:MAG: Bor family protein [Flavicella sp.]
MTSCYTYTRIVGEGLLGIGEVKAKNHYLIGRLAPVGVSDSKEMAAGAKNYEVTTSHTFVDGLLAFLTSSIYTPTTTVVKK